MEDNLESKIELKWKLSEGFYSEVYLAVFKGQHVAVKIPKNEGFNEFIEKEYGLYSRINIKEMLKCMGIYEREGKKVLVLEFPENTKTLKEIIQEQAKKQRFLPTQYSFSLIEDIVKAIKNLHSKGFFHGDIKPSNIMIKHYGTEEQEIKIIDFNLSGEVIDGNSSGIYLSPSDEAGIYLSPSNYSGTTQKASKITDISQLGSVIYEILTLRKPIERIPREVHEINKEIPAQIDDIIRRCWNKEYKAIEELERDISSLILEQKRLERKPEETPERYYLRRIRENPRDLEARRLLADLFYQKYRQTDRKGYLKKALKHYKIVLKKEPNNLEARIGLVKTYAEFKNEEKAVDEVNKIKLDPRITTKQLLDLSLCLAFVEGSGNALLEATNLVSIALNKEPKNIELLMQLAFLYQLAYLKFPTKGWLRDAADTYREILEIDPNNVAAKDSLRKIEYALRKLGVNI